ncbi:hypothetical protein GEMRC1_008726 [Eukaryota sp. GEM-RC1]
MISPNHTTMSANQFRKNVRIFLWVLALGFSIAIHVILFHEKPQFLLAVAASILAPGCLLGFRIIAEPVTSKSFNVVLFVLLLASLIRLFLVRYRMNTDEYDLYFLLILSSQFCCLVILTNLNVNQSFAALAVISALSSILSRLPAGELFSNSMSFTAHIAAHPLEDFRKVVNYPEHYIRTDIDDVLSARTKNGFYVLSGPLGVGKSVALFEHLRKEHVIWLNARIALCENLRDLGFTVSTDSVDTCRNILHVAI